MASLYAVLIGWVSRRETQGRQQQEQDREPAGEDRGDEGARQHEIARVQVEQQFRHQKRRKQEDERMRPERDLLPEIGEKGPVVGRNA